MKVTVELDVSIAGVVPRSQDEIERSLVEALDRQAKRERWAFSGLSREVVICGVRLVGDPAAFREGDR